MPLEGVEGLIGAHEEEVKRIEAEKIAEFIAENPTSLTEVDPTLEGVDQSTLRSEVKIQ